MLNSCLRRTRNLVAALLLLTATTPAIAQSSVGEVHFENSGAAEAQESFQRGLALLHNFEFDFAAAAFREAQTADPDFAMAYWGEAMTYNHPVWFEQDRDKALAALKRLGKSAKQRRKKAKTPRERAYLDAVEILYGDSEKYARDEKYSNAMGALHETYRDDVDARAFYAVSILGLAHNGRDFSLYMRSAALLEEIFPDNKSHPGVLHYLIHSYDDPVHAPLGLRAARLYGAVAPRAGHALHMTSHIFTAMGMWDDVIAANQQAMLVVNEQRAAAGRAERHCGHYNEWLVYGFLQRGETSRADEIIAACRSAAMAELADKPIDTPTEGYWSSVFSHSDIALRRLVDTGEWADPIALAPADGTYLMSGLMSAYGNVLAHRGEAGALGAANAKLAAAQAALIAANETLEDSEKWFADAMPILALQASGLEKLANGEGDAGIDDLKAAAKAEAAMPPEFGPPAIAKPSFELLAEELARLGRRDEARTAYEKALALAPQRRLSVEGLKGL